MMTSGFRPGGRPRTCWRDLIQRWWALLRKHVGQRLNCSRRQLQAIPTSPKRLLWWLQPWSVNIDDSAPAGCPAYDYTSSRKKSLGLENRFKCVVVVGSWLLPCCLCDASLLCHTRTEHQTLFLCFCKHWSSQKTDGLIGDEKWNR